MNFEWFIALRFLFSKKKHQAVHIISIISIAGIMIGTMALVTVLSVFNGFDNLIKSMFSSFNPDLKVLPASGKFFPLDSTMIYKIKNINGVNEVAYVVEESVLLEYNKRQYIASIKGVSDNFFQLHPLQDKIQGSSLLQKNHISYAIVGAGVSYYLGLNIDLLNPIWMYMPRKDANIFSNPEEAFQRLPIYPAGIFSIEQDVDNKYVIVPYSFACKLLMQDKWVSYLEIQLGNNTTADEVKTKIHNLLGNDFEIKDRYQQQELLYKILKSEKWAVFFILLFILLVASLNMISSLTMIMIEKRQNILILSHLGADQKSIQRIFLFYGWFSVILGCILGILLGISICLLQEYFGIVKLQGMSSFVIESYPVKIIWSDIVLITFTVLFIGWITAYLPVKALSKRWFK